MQPIRRFEEGHINVYIFICYLAYLSIASYKNQISVNGWEGVREGLDEMRKIRKLLLLLEKRKSKSLQFSQSGFGRGAETRMGRYNND